MIIDRTTVRTVLGFVLALSMLSIAHAQSPTSKALMDYADSMAKCQVDLEKGRIDEVRKRLETTDKSLRSFEYEYMLTRADAATVSENANDLVRTVEAPKIGTRYAVLNPVNRQLVFICRDGGLRIYDLADANKPEKLVMHEGAGAIWSGAFSADGKTFAAGFEQGTVVVWNANNWERLATAAIGTKQVRELVVSPDGSAFVAEGDTKLELWSMTGGEPKKVSDVGTRYNFGAGLAFSPNGDLIATGGMFDILLFDAKTGEQTHAMKHASYTMGLEFSPDGKRIASSPRGNVNKFLAVFDVSNGAMQFNSRPLPCYIHGGIFTSDGKRIVSTACEKVPFLQLFDSTTGHLIYSLPRSANGSKPAVSRDGKVLGWTEPQAFRFIDLDQKQPGEKS